MRNLATRNPRNLAEPSRNFRGTSAEPCGTLEARESLKKFCGTFAEPCGTFATFAEPCGTFATFTEPLRNLAEPSQQGKSLRKPLRNLAEPSRNFRGTFAEPSGNLKGNLKGILQGTLRNPRNPQPATSFAEPGPRASGTNSSVKVRTPKASLVGEKEKKRRK